MTGQTLWARNVFRLGSKYFMHCHRNLHLTYTRRDLPQQLTQVDHLTKGLYDRMSPVHWYLLEIEPIGDGGVLRQPKKEHGVYMPGDECAVTSIQSNDRALLPMPSFDASSVCDISDPCL